MYELVVPVLPDARLPDNVTFVVRQKDHKFIWLDGHDEPFHLTMMKVVGFTTGPLPGQHAIHAETGEVGLVLGISVRDSVVFVDTNLGSDKSSCFITCDPSEDGFEALFAAWKQAKELNSYYALKHPLNDLHQSLLTNIQKALSRYATP